MKLLAAFLILCAVCQTDVQSQSWESGSVRIMQRVDTAHPVIRRVLQQWVDSLAIWRDGAASPMRSRGAVSSSKQVIQDWFSQSSHVVAEYTATVLSTEFDGTGWVVRTLFAFQKRGSTDILPLGMFRCRFVKVSSSQAPSTLVMEENVTSQTQNWSSTRIDRMTYVHNPTETVDSARAQLCEGFLRDISERFGLEAPKAITVILARSRDELCGLLGVEYYAFPPQAISFPEENTILEASSEVFHPHELAHVVFKEFNGADPVLREGIATLLGGSGKLDFADALAQYLDARSGSRIPSFVEVFTGTGIDQSDQYILGAVVCDIVLRYHGRAMLLELLRMDRPSEVMLTLCKILGYDIEDRQGSMRPLAEAAHVRNSSVR